MVTYTVETALAQLSACREDFQTLVRERREKAKAELAEAAKQAAIIKAADADAVTFLRAAAAAATDADLKRYINGALALHEQVKRDQIAEASATGAA